MEGGAAALTDSGRDACLACLAVVGLPKLFAGKAFTIQPVPLQGGADAAMRWWRESAHFRRALGDRVLDRALATRAGASLPPWFGPRPTMGNLDAHLERIEAARRAWIERSPNQVRWFRRVAGGSPGLE